MEEWFHQVAGHGRHSEKWSHEYQYGHEGNVGVSDIAQTLKRMGVICFMRGLLFDGSTVRKAEPNIWEFMSKNVEHGWRCVDVGANRGEYSFLMAKLAGPSGFVHAFELHPENSRLATYNNWRFRHRVKVENLAVTNGQQACVEVFSGKDRSGAEWNIVGSGTQIRPILQNFQFRLPH